MALGTAEATPLQVATGFTIFANLGDKVSPIAINRVTTGDGRIVVEPKGERKNVIRPDVAFIVTDILKDVINRGTAYEAQAWGFKNQAGKRGFAGKTGTSRDGWFAGFTPELVTVVYVGFDDGSDLGMKGSDSAMPIWADFMREALNLYPELNADWQMPETVRQAEIDTRNGSLIKELNSSEAETVKNEQAALKNNANKNTESDLQIETPELEEIYVTDVPAEFRRVEYFVSGTVPNKSFLPVKEPDAEIDKNPNATPTPFVTWQEDQQNQGQNQTNSNRQTNSVEDLQQNLTVMMCPITGMRATSNCPNMKPETFRQGSEPKEFCRFHVAPPR